MAELTAEQEYEAFLARVAEYGTMYTNSLFESNDRTWKFSRMGMAAIRVSKTGTVVAILMLALYVAISFFVAFKILNIDPLYSLIVLTFGIPVAALGYKLGTWSPLQKTTGEDLWTWALMRMRKKVALGGFFAPKPSVAMRRTRAIGGEEGRMIACQRFIGTQPLTRAITADEGKDSVRYEIVPCGQYKPVDVSRHNDGLGDRGLV